MVDGPVIDESLAALERAFVDESLRSRGYTRESLAALPRQAANRILSEAEEEASLLLAQIDSRAMYLKTLHTRR